MQSFSETLLEGIFQVYKQKELLEDAIIIYRTQRASKEESYVDVGNMPTLAMQFVERVKTEIPEKDPPRQGGGGGGGTTDLELLQLIHKRRLLPSQTAEGRGSKG